MTDWDSAMQVDGVQASIILDDFFDVGESMLKSNPEVIKLCTDFGIPSMDHVAIDCWPSALSLPSLESIKSQNHLRETSLVFLVKNMPRQGSTAMTVCCRHLMIDKCMP